MAQLWNPNAPCADLNTERGLRRLTQLILGTRNGVHPTESLHYRCQAASSHSRKNQAHLKRK